MLCYHERLRCVAPLIMQCAHLHNYENTISKILHLRPTTKQDYSTYYQLMIHQDIIFQNDFNNLAQTLESLSYMIECLLWKITAYSRSLVITFVVQSSKDECTKLRILDTQITKTSWALLSILYFWRADPTDIQTQLRHLQTNVYEFIWRW